MIQPSSVPASATCISSCCTDEARVPASMAPVDVVRGGYIYIYRPVTCYIPSESHPLRHLPAQALISTALLGWDIVAAAACCKSRTQRCSRLLDVARNSLFSLSVLIVHRVLSAECGKKNGKGTVRQLDLEPEPEPSLLGAT